MPNTKVFTRSFAGGELSEAMFGRIDDAKYQSGAAVMDNFIATPQGPAENRPGFAYVNATKNNGVARLIPFVYSNSQSMVIELGDKYIRFHTQGKTLEYSPTGIRPWVQPSGPISLSYTTPTTVSWASHGLSTGDPIRFYMASGHTPADLPSGLQVGYTYTVQVLDAGSFNILDNGTPVGLTGGANVGGTSYPGTGTATAEVDLDPGNGDPFSDEPDPEPGRRQYVSTEGIYGSPFSTQFSSVLSGLPNVVVPGGVVTLNLNVDTEIYTSSGSFGSVLYQYNNGSGWMGLPASSATNTISTQINLTNLNLLQLRVTVTGRSSATAGVTASGTINSWSVLVPSSGGGGGFDAVKAYRYYTAGDTVSYGSNNYAAVQVDTGGTITPGTNSSVWYLLPANLIYEIASPYSSADVFAIHYAQSADVMTLVHPNYAPMELRRLGALNWTLTPVSFAPAYVSPTGVAVTASPGYLAQITNISNDLPAAVFTTRANHTLAQGDGVYVSGLIAGGSHDLSGFYLVSSVPKDNSGNLIGNQLKLMDYSGNDVNTSTWGYYSLLPGTIQYGDKIFNISSSYAVAAVDSGSSLQGSLSAPVSVVNNLNVPGSYNVITWTAVAGATNYYVFKQKNGLWGYIGEAQGTTFTDNNIAPDFSITPVTLEQPFTNTDNYPAAVGYIEQRRCFAGTNNQPQTLWMTNSGTESTLAYSLPSKDTDRISVKVASREVSHIQHIVPLNQMLLLTGSCEYAEYTTSDGPITPSTIGIRPQSFIGASVVQPTVVNNLVLYCAARGGHVRELGYSLQANSFVTGDLSLRAAHLFDQLTIVDQSFSKAPLPIAWFVSSNGNLLGITYVPEQQIGAWHHHTTLGAFESIAAVPEGNEDRLYAVVRRTVNGNTVRYIERMASRLVEDLQDCFFVDAGATYTGTSPVTTISGLTWLEGSTVAVLADGAVHSQKVVVNGTVELDHPATVVQIGLPYTADLQTLPPTIQVDGYGQGRQLNVNKVWVRVYQSSGIFVGPDEDSLMEYKQRTTQTYGTPPDLESGQAEVTLLPKWNTDGQVFIRQENPLPLTVVSLTAEMAVGG